jgi:PAS domain S-box-containing protein
MKEVIQIPQTAIANRYPELLTLIVRDIVSSLDLETIILKVYENLQTMVNQSIFAIGIYNHQTQTLDFYGVGDNHQTVREGRLSLEDSHLWAVQCFIGQEELVHNQMPEFKGFSSKLFITTSRDRKSFAYFPITVKEKPLGVLTLQSFEENSFSPALINILRVIANFTGIAIENAQAYKQIEAQKIKIETQSRKLINYQEHLEDLVSERTLELQYQKQILEQQSQKLEMLSIVAKETENAIMIMNPMGNILWINDCFTRIYGYGLEDFIAARGNNIRKTSFNPDIDKTLDECLLHKKPMYYEAPNITKEGSECWTQTSLTPILDNEGNVRFLVTIDSDITERKKHEEQILRFSLETAQSIQYARKIQKAMLPSPDLFNDFFDELFIMLKPRSVVSGDFYWGAVKGELAWIAAVDCTGHGVPGAMMSMLGTSLLNQIVSDPQAVDVAFVLKKLREWVKASLNQSGISGEPKDGMDISLCMIDKTNGKLHFAGAYQSIVKVAANGELSEIKGDKMPIGVHWKEKECFTRHVIPWLPGDTFYIYSDGFYSQFGGKDNKKYNACRFRELLHKNAVHPLSEQKLLLEEELRHWKNNQKQIDDILVIGFKVE